MAVLKPFQRAIIKQILEDYTYNLPFHLYFSYLCKQHKNWGSKDRKLYKQICYAVFRLGFIRNKLTLEDLISKAAIINETNIEHNELIDIFPFQEVLCTKLNYMQWLEQITIPKPVYLKAAQGIDNLLLQINKLGIEATIHQNEIIEIATGTACDTLINAGWAWVMDASSQLVCEKINISEQTMVWDCCSGAGGKALYLTQKYQNLIQLTCTDKRFSVLENLKKRFKLYELPMPEIELIDLYNSTFHKKQKYDIIIADVPCSGSGTWGRTPENIIQFNSDLPLKYSFLQRRIVENAIKNLNLGGSLYYITCSIFKAENEENVNYFKEKFGLHLVEDELVHAIENKSDYLYLAHLKLEK